MLAPIGAGFVTGGSLIVAIGAQNAYVLRQGLSRSHTGAVVALCALSDIVLITAGVAGVGAVVAETDWLIEAVTWFGVAFLLWYAVGSARRALRPDALVAAGASGPAGPAGPAGQVESRGRVLARAAALTWLNPHVYLDTVLLIGSIAAGYAVATEDGIGVLAGVDGRWLFALGAAAASVVWFTGLGYGARRLAPLLARPRAWQVVELLIAVTMVLVAAKLAFG